MKKGEKILNVDPPRLSVFHQFHTLVKEKNGLWEWKGKTIEVEVTSLHFRTGKMRVRSVDKIKTQNHLKAERVSFDIPYTEFFENYTIEKKEKTIS